MRIAAFAASLALAACANYEGGDLGADLACGVRENVCVDQCREQNPYSDDITACEAQCAPSDATVCR